jgi:hypothetical protein
MLSNVLFLIDSGHALPWIVWAPIELRNVPLKSRDRFALSSTQSFRAASFVVYR